MLVNEQWIFLKDVSKLIEKIESLGFIATAGEMWRTEVQAWLNSRPANSSMYVRDNQNNLHTYTVPVGGVGVMMSKHRDRLAVDFNFFKQTEGKLIQVTTKQDLQILGDYWESLSDKNRWGGNFSTRLDCPHFERNV